MNKQIGKLLVQIEMAERAFDLERVRALRKELSEERRRYAAIRHAKVAQRQGEHVIRAWRSETPR